MASVGRILSLEIRQSLQNYKSILSKDCRKLSSLPSVDEASSQNKPSEKVQSAPQTEERKNIAPLEFRFMYPEFLPHPKAEWRNSLREKMERMDMMARRAHIDIPTFYVGSIVAVTHSDPHAVGKTNRFVGICIQRLGYGLRAQFLLRNAVDQQGIEVMFDMYDPTLQKVECLRLEKRLDEELLYLRDAPIEYSTFPFDMEPEILPEGTPVRINELKVPLKPKPWYARWERMDLKGVLEVKVNKKQAAKALLHKKPWEKYDLMKTYRNTIPIEDQRDIFAEVYSELHQLEITRRKLSRKRTFTRPVKTA